MEPIILRGPTSRHFQPFPMREIPVHFERFPSGESYSKIEENIRGRDVFVVQSICAPANDNLMDLMVVGDAARRASAGRLTAVIPFLGYMRQDRKDKPRVPISAKLVMNMLEAAGYERVITIDVHTLQAQGFTDLPFDHLFSFPLFADYFRANLNMDNAAFVGPDIGSVKRTQAYAEAFNAPMAIVNKKRMSSRETKAQSLIGDVEGLDVIITDDLTESAGTLIGAAKITRSFGAKSVIVAVTHNCLHKEGFYNLHGALTTGVIDGFITTNTICTTYIPAINTVVLKTDGLIAEAIKRTNQNESITDLFEVKGF